MTTFFSALEWGNIQSSLAAGLNIQDHLGLEYHEILDYRQEVRLRFNCPARVASTVVRLLVSSPKSGKFSGDIEVFHWLDTDEWDIGEVQLGAVVD
jgi:hypothetical protein